MKARALALAVVAVIVFLIVTQVLITVFLQTNPPTVKEPPWDSPQTRALAQRACLDCHSNQTAWPIYSRIPPASWLVTLDVIRARRHLNFSEWSAKEAAGPHGAAGHEEAKAIQEGKMPPGNYLLLHPEARLTDAEKQQLIQGLQASLK